MPDLVVRTDPESVVDVNEQKKQSIDSPGSESPAERRE